MKGPVYLRIFSEKCLSFVLQSVTVQKFTPNHVDSGFFVVTPDEIETKDLPSVHPEEFSCLKTAEAEPKTVTAPYSVRRICKHMF